MFTVKVRARDGVETLYSAETVEVVRDKGQFEDGVFLDWPLPHYPEAERPAAKHIFAITSPYSPCPPPAAAGQAQQATWPPKVWVMNEAGATVATYDL